ncbi:charged multivesicular body protein 6 [Trichogramma pretiosum]|uniref:charged multivesicular body protein 6 n=1 Tax=Trichogramma pretiosum TaxID=7493 RepID=UPI0006C9D9A0|nr:charged multivesicular body protein 6 [Trichogramma pretiosum]
MGILFAKKKPSSRVTDQDKAVLQLKQTRDKMKQYQRRIEQNIERDREIAKKLISKNQKDRALLLLRKKKFQEQILVKTDGQLENVERMVHDIEFAQVETKVIEGLKSGNDALKTLHALLSIEEIENIMDDTREGIEKQQEINALLVGSLTDDDETEVEAELDSLLMQESENESHKKPTQISLPDVPTDVPVDVTADESTKQKEPKQNKKEPLALEA